MPMAKASPYWTGPESALAESGNMPPYQRRGRPGHWKQDPASNCNKRPLKGFFCNPFGYLTFTLQCPRAGSFSCGTKLLRLTNPLSNGNGSSHAQRAGHWSVKVKYPKGLQKNPFKGRLL